MCEGTFTIKTVKVALDYDTVIFVRKNYTASIGTRVFLNL